VTKPEPRNPLAPWPAEKVDPWSGAVLFARYAYPPNALGYCGPDNPNALLRAAARDEADSDLRSLVGRFAGASAYLALIAACSGLDDPFDRRVVEAYWIGNELLELVPPGALARCWAGPLDKLTGHGAAVEATGPGVPQHSFHVFAVYPWLGVLRSGREQPALEVLDRCRIRWGRVEEVSDAMATVRTQALVFDGSHLLLGRDRIERVRCSDGGLGLAPRIQPGDIVALHWDWVCDRLTEDQLSWLQACTQRNLDAVNDHV
jgi:hypothetical protein